MTPTPNNEALADTSVGTALELAYEAAKYYHAWWSNEPGADAAGAWKSAPAYQALEAHLVRMGAALDSALASSGQAAFAVPLKDEDHAWADAMVRHLKAQGEDVNLEKSALETLFVIARFIALDTVAEAEKPGYDPHKPVSFAFMEAIERYGRASPTQPASAPAREGASEGLSKSKLFSLLQTCTSTAPVRLPDGYVAFARAVEAAHGISAPKEDQE